MNGLCKQFLAFCAVLAWCPALSEYNEAATQVKLIRADEFKSRTTYWLTQAGSPPTYVRNTGNKHLLELRFKWGTPSNGGGGATPDPEAPLSLLQTVSATAGTGGGGTNPPPTPIRRTITYFTIAVVHVGMANEVPLERMGMSAKGTILPDVVGNIRHSSNSGTGPGLRHILSYNDEVGVHVISDSNGHLPGKIINVVVECHITEEELQNNNWVVISYTHTGQRVTYDCEKKAPLHVASIDSRRCYGQPNAEGALMADANAELRNPAFPNWVYKGGLFVGMMPWQTGDQSGLARCQLLFEEINQQLYIGAPEPRLVSLACFDMGRPSSVGGDIVVGAYSVTAGATPPYRFTWDNRWSIAPRTTPSTPPDHSCDPWSTNTLSSSSQEYVNWLLTDITQTTRSYWIMGGIVLALNGESQVTWPVWRYFASPAYQSLFPTTPILSDCQPRLWVIWSKEEQSWTYPYGN